MTWPTKHAWKAFSATATSKPWFIWPRRPEYRRSITSPDEYVASNLVGFVNVLEGVRACSCRHFVFASSSSVYGSHNKIPFAEEDSTDYPVSLYAATKKSNEVVAHAYSHLFHIPTTGLRFFTVYGPWGRPDMAIFKFVDAVMGGRVIELYNFGRLQRDFTFVDDIVEGIVRLLPLPPHWDKADGPGAQAPMRLCNIGNQQPVELLHLVRTIESCLGRSADIRFMPMQPGDVYETQARVEKLKDVTGYSPRRLHRRWHTAICGMVSRRISAPWSGRLTAVSSTPAGAKRPSGCSRNRSRGIAFTDIP